MQHKTTLLFGNIYINNREKYTCFKHTIVQLAPLFNHVMIRFRGAYSKECKDFINKNIDHKNLQVSVGTNDEDWALSALRILEINNSGSVFIYVEDHVLIAEPSRLMDVISDFETCGLDYMPYSFFNSNKLFEENILLLEPNLTKNLAYFKLNNRNQILLSQISPRYCTFSLPCLCSRDYFIKLLKSEVSQIKIYSKFINRIACRFFPYPSHRILYNQINHKVRWLGLKICDSSPITPFNLERLNIEKSDLSRDIVIGVPLNELLAAYDDDNISYSESAVKRGYLMRHQQLKESGSSHRSIAKFTIELTPGVARNLKMVNHMQRSSFLYLVSISTKEASVLVTSKNSKEVITIDSCKLFYANQDLLVVSEVTAAINVEVFKVSVYE